MDTNSSNFHDLQQRVGKLESENRRFRWIIDDLIVTMAQVEETALSTVGKGVEQVSLDDKEPGLAKEPGTGKRADGGCGNDEQQPQRASIQQVLPHASGSKSPIGTRHGEMVKAQASKTVRQQSSIVSTSCPSRKSRSPKIPEGDKGSVQQVYHSQSQTHGPSQPWDCRGGTMAATR